MSAAADVIILSSSPDRIPPGSPVPPAHDPERLFDLSPRDLSPSPVRSPSELFQVPTRSRFFEVGNRSDKSLRNRENEAPEETPIRKTTTVSKSVKASTEDKPKRGGRKPATESQTVPGFSESAGLVHANALKKTTGSKKKRMDNEGKRGRPVSKIITGRVAKTGNAQALELKEKGMDVDMSTPKISSEKEFTNGLVEWGTEDLQLEPAMKRRMDWTPIKDTTTQRVELGGEWVSQDSSKNFGSLLSEYGFNDDPSARDEVRRFGDEGPTKRRRIELVDSRLFTSSKQASIDIDDKSPTEDEQQIQPGPKKKPKRQTNKFTTLTARVTARYLNTEGSVSSSKETTTSGESAASAKSKGPKGKGKGASKHQEPEFIVLSPEAAVKSLEEQDLIFGTCSQLEREGSPTTLRDLQAAITESEKYLVTEPSPLGSSLCATPTSRFATSRGLWSVAARDLEGSLTRQVEIVDLVDTPEPAKTMALPSDHSVEKELADIAITTNSRPTSIPRGEPPVLKVNPVARREPSVAPDTTTRKTTSEPKKTTSQVPEPQPEKPHYSGFTDAELSKQVAAYGFKAVKNRKKMIDLLQKCWESKHGRSTIADTRQTAPAEPTAELTTSEPKIFEKQARKTTTSRKTTAKPKTKRDSKAPTKSRTKKTPSTTSTTANSKAPSARVEPSQALPTRSFINIEEIEDSEEETQPSPSRLQNRYTLQPSETRNPLTVSKTPSSPSRRSAPKPRINRPASKASPENDQKQPDLADQITKAMRAQPAGTPSHPSWHEKILMYDPIVLEDFATWLNNEGLGLVGEDREVGAGFLRTWCESHGICCCYR
ncbi:hypothetical protein BDV23DRAFT_185371 [Aspergillus alliaceus]|uniref:Structure-specific endonuclease subunit SLX4 n=1 Tax=Petromyces alliaceus TaxID=209559 RepID=A0A5N7C3L3_PETAA|nr:hypothetical protein BDV23DRAFT_185371 [Aspergillus alliaceus]